MAVSSVTTSSSSAQHTLIVQASKAQGEPSKARQVQQQEQKQEPVKPVINTQGETTGQVISTSA